MSCVVLPCLVFLSISWMVKVIFENLLHVHVHVHSMLQVIRLALERLQIFEDKTLYELYEGRSGEDEAVWKLLNEGEYPVIRQEN